MPTVIELAERYHDALERQDMRELRRIIDAYARIQTRLQGEIDALALEISKGAIPTRAQVLRMERYKRLLNQAGEELEKFSNYLGVELPTIGRAMVDRGISESLTLMQAALDDNPVLVARLRDLSPETVERLLGFLDPDGPLMERLKLLAPHATEQLANAILENIALGRNPRAWAREVTRALGVGLTDALRMARTVQLWAYRESSRANYIANSDVVRGWEWLSRQDELVCPACLAMHGTLHTLDESLNGHHNCRCVAIPYTILSPNGHGLTPGEDWLKSQPEAVQQKILGKGAYEAYKSGKFSLSDVVKEHDDDVYGLMKGTKPLKELLGGE